jgi:hypothetical protein
MRSGVREESVDVDAAFSELTRDKNQVANPMPGGHVPFEECDGVRIGDDLHIRGKVEI